MKAIRILVVIACAMLAACTADTGYNRTQHGVIVKLEQSDPAAVRLVRLQVISDKVIHVTATPDTRFSGNESLIVVPWERTADFTVEEIDNHVRLSTAYLAATVNLQTGEVKFADRNGKTLLAEEAGGGKTFRPMEIEGTPGYEMRQVFESPADEAFYGLGQHQADEFNYKGRNEELFQYNTKVSVPFILSNKNYGLLWDNYSLSRFGDNRGYANLDQAFTLYNKEGKADALTGSYTSAGKNEPDVVRDEKNIYFEDLKTIKNLPADFPLQGASVRYEGMIEPRETGLFHFYLYYAGYVKVYLNGELVVPERWRTAWNPNGYKFAIDLEAGRKIPLTIEWQPDGGESYCGLRVLTPVPEADRNKLAIFSEMGDEIDYYFMAGDDMDDVIGGYRLLTGKAPIMPKWAMGYWQSRERYKTQNEIVTTLREFRRRRIPIDNIVQDWSYWPEDAWGSHEFDPARFPDPRQMVDDIHALNGRLMISVWPKFYATTEHYKEFDAMGWMYQRAVQDSIRDWIGPGYIGSFYDAYSEGAQKLFWQQLKEHLYPLGIDAWWMDASEPNIRDCTDMEYRKALCGPTELGPSTKYFNAYALMNAKAIYDGLRDEDPDTRVFQLTRSGFAGLQRYATATWSGDIATRWEDLKAQIPAGLNFALSGVPYWTMDIGGFCVEKRYENSQRRFDQTGRESPDHKEWRELNARWFQFGAFVPLFRSHGQYPYREPWHIAPEGHPAYESMLYYSRLRYNLMPYIYSLAAKVHFDDYTLMRALVMDFGSDKATTDVGDQFLLGPSLMACPVYEYGARTREVYFPQSGWYDFYSGRFTQGGKLMKVDAPYERIPLYVRAGSIIPMGRDMQYTNEKPDELITLYIYTGADAQFSLYEDEGVNYNYEKGLCATIPLDYNDRNRTLTIGERNGEFPGMLRERRFKVVVVDKHKPVPFSMKADGQIITYSGSPVAVEI